MAEARASGDRTPQSSSGSLKRPKTSKLSGGRTASQKKSVESGVPDGDELDQSMGDTNGDVTTNGYVEEDTAVDSVEDSSMPIMPNDDDVEMVDGAIGGMDESLPVQEDLPAEPNPPKKKSGRGRPAKNRPSDASVLSLSTATTRGRPPTVHRDTENEQAESTATTTQKRGKKDKALRDVSAVRGPNAQIRPASKTRGKVSRSASRVSLSRFVQRSETPGNGEGALITRSGRHSIQPLAHWRGERAVFEPGHIDQTGLTLGGIKEVIRTDEIIDKRPRNTGYRRPRPRAKTQKLEDLEEDDEDKEPWEVETGVIHARVMAWDSGANHYIEEETEEKGRSFIGLVKRHVLDDGLQQHITHTCMQKSPMPPIRSRCATSPVPNSVSQRRLRCRSSDRAWSIYHQAGRKEARTVGRCRWFSLYSTVGSRSRLARRLLGLGLGRGGCGRFLEVS